MTSAQTGFVVRLDLNVIQHAVEATARPAEVILVVSIGTYVAYGDPLAEIRAAGRAEADAIAAAVQRGVHLERQRNIDDVDPGYGVEQLEDVAWTAISSAKHTPLKAGSHS